MQPFVKRFLAYFIKKKNTETVKKDKRNEQARNRSKGFLLVTLSNNYGYC